MSTTSSRLASEDEFVDVQTWDGEHGLERYLRTQFEVPDSVKKIGLKGKVLLLQSGYHALAWENARGKVIDSLLRGARYRYNYAHSRKR